MLWGDGMAMKAWLVHDKWCNECNEIIFAETRGKAIVEAQSCDQFWDYNFIEMTAVRYQVFDKFYKPGKWRMDWDDPEDRVAMVRFGGAYCSDEMDVSIEECERCEAHPWCTQYDDMMLLRRMEEQKRSRQDGQV